MRALRTRDAKPRTLFDADADYRKTSPNNPVAIGDHIDPVTIALPSGRATRSRTRATSPRVGAAHAGDLRVTRLWRTAAASAST